MADEMMTDEEQVERLRQWWAEYGRLVIAGIVLGLGLLFGGQAWRDHRERQLIEASNLYEELRQAAAAAEIDRVEALAGQLAEDYPQSPYDTQARLLLAKMRVDRGDLEAALDALEAAVASAETDEISSIARTRQARVLLSLGRADEVLELLGTQPEPEFAALHHELVGDALAELGRKAEARTAYNDALLALPPQARSGRLLQLKIAALGSPEAPAAAMEGTGGSESADGDAPMQDDGGNGADDGSDDGA